MPREEFSLHYNNECEKSTLMRSSIQPYSSNASGLRPLSPGLRIFFKSPPSTTWRRVKDGQLKSLGGEGNIRINLNSLAQFLNLGCEYEVNYKRGQRPRTQKAKAAGAK